MMGEGRRFAVIAAAVALLVGLGLGSLLHVVSDAREPSVQSRSGEAQASPGAASVDALEALRADLAAERAERIALAAELRELRSTVEHLAPGAEAPTPPVAAFGPSAAGRTEPEAHAASPASDRLFDESALIERGIPADEVGRLRRYYEESEMEILYLRDRAAREGWERRRQIVSEVAKLRAGLREEVGDEAYDLMLYATGQDNRAVITDVLATSPALAADLQPGDVILRYDDRAIFAISELQGATRSGEVGTQVAIEVLRGSDELRVFVPRGPLGVRLEAARRAPDTY
jgi:hypothetical protein